MTERRMTRRAAVSLLCSLPLAARIRMGPQQRTPRRIFHGIYHSLLLEPDGRLAGWCSPAAQQANASGELGQGHANPLKPYTLYPIPGLSNVVAAGAGWDSSFAVQGDGRVFAWGANRGGILGIMPVEEVEVSAEARVGPPTPTEVAARFDAVDISVGHEHVLALARDGSVWAWGEGGQGRLGVGTLPVINFKTHRPAPMKYLVFPVRIPGLSDVVVVSAGGDHSLALLKDGRVLSWGANKYGQLGDGTTIDRTTPVPVQGIGKAIAICAGSLISFAVLEDGTTVAWGNDAGGSLGRPGDGNPSPVPRPVPGVAGARLVSGGATGVVLTQAGTLMAWGYNAHGEAGRGTYTANDPVPPATIKGLSGVRWMRMHEGMAMVVLDDGRIFTWGGVRPYISPDGRSRIWSANPVLLSVDGLDNPG